jgi:AraC family ethanolamine operon transcriptional activator
MAIVATRAPHRDEPKPDSQGAAQELASRVTFVQGFDGDALTHVLRGSRIRHAQLSAGRFDARIYRLSLETSVVDSGAYNLPVHGQGSFPQDCVVLGTLLNNQGPAWNGPEPIDRGDLVFCGPGAPLDVVLGHEAHWVAFGIPLHRLEEEARRRAVVLPERLDRIVVSRVASETFDLLDGVIREALDLVVNERSALDIAEVRIGVERTVSHAFLLAMGATAGSEEGRNGAGAAKRAAAARRASVIRRAEELIESKCGAPVYLSELCDATGVSERTLRYIFEWRFGMSPIAYLRARRLCGVRRDLLRARGTEIVVKEVARRWGYWHCGRLAAEYRQQFGETPSETVGRSPRRRSGDAPESPPVT